MAVAARAVAQRVALAAAMAMARLAAQASFAVLKAIVRSEAKVWAAEAMEMAAAADSAGVSAAACDHESLHEWLLGWPRRRWQ